MSCVSVFGKEFGHIYKTVRHEHSLPGISAARKFIL